ncbi:MAG: HAMP domain-containing sensor histidine kinase [Actinomycetota bacterium]
MSGVGPRSLRGRLLAATLVLVAVGLTGASIATYAFLNSFLVSRVDDQLRAILQNSDAAAVADRDGEPAHVFVPFGGVYAAYLDPDGAAIQENPLRGYDGRAAPAPFLPSALPGSTGSPGTGFRLFTAGSATDLRYRVIAEAVADGGGTVVVAIPLTDIAETLHRLVVVEALVVAGALVLAAASALGLVRLGLRPLTDIEETAGAIAAGDLSQRVTPAEPGTEVGRLGIALNAMLAQIEAAFAERTASEERLRRFVADASHELRTPLTSIGGYAQLFRHGAADHPDDLAKTMDRIEREAARMGVLVEDLLLLARMDEGMTVSRTSFDLAALAARAVEDARAADPTGGKISLTAPAPVPVEADEDRLKQVLDNLLANARAHTPPGTPVAVRVAGHEGTAVLEVADEGPGVPPEDRTRVFERFYRADESRSRSGGGGAGLGLAIAAEIARAHGGTLELVPTDVGATFRLTLPPATPVDV